MCPYEEHGNSTVCKPVRNSKVSVIKRKGMGEVKGRTQASAKAQIVGEGIAKGVSGVKERKRMRLPVLWICTMDGKTYTHDEDPLQ